MLDESPQQVQGRDGSRALVGLFGKHPAWSDHIEDIGLDSPSLKQFKKMFYLDGIRSNLDTGTWDRLEPDQRIEEWNHQLMMIGTSGMILARVWATSDARGRRSYPMVCAIHLPTPRPPSDLGPLFEILESVRSACVHTKSQEGVMEAAGMGVSELSVAVSSLAAAEPDGPSPELRRECMHKGEVGIERLVHVMNTELGGSANSPRRDQVAKPRAFRLARVGCSLSSQLLVWRAFFRPHLHPDCLWTAVTCLDEDWIDIWTGGLDNDQVFRSRCTTNRFPIISNIPYNVPEDVKARAREIMLAFYHPPTRIPSLPSSPDSDPKRGGLGSIFGRFFKGG